MTNKVEYIIQRDSILRRTITENELGDCTAVFDQISASVVRKQRFVFSLPGLGPVGGTITALTDSYWTVRLPTLTLRAPFALDKAAGVLIPNFSGTDSVLSLNWTPPTSPPCQLVLLVNVRTTPDYCSAGMVWLFALDDRKGAWRLPLPNLFADARVCTGWNERDVPHGLTVADTVNLVVNSVTQSHWNADLWETHMRQKTFGMFRFKPEADKFIVQPPTKPWTELCDKVGVQQIQMVVL